MFQKNKRIINKNLTNSYQGKRCRICSSTKGSSGHHLKSKGSGGPDVHNNLICLCLKHHNEIHKSGLMKFSKDNPKIVKILIEKCWDYCDFNGWKNYDLYEKTPIH